MPTLYQQETLESILALFLQGQGHSLPHHCSTKSESAISRFFNHYQWSTRSLIRTVRSCILNGLEFPVFCSWVWLKRDGKRVQRLGISPKPMKGKTIARWGKRRWQIEGFFKPVKHRFSLHRFGQNT